MAGVIRVSKGCLKRVWMVSGGYLWYVMCLDLSKGQVRTNQAIGWLKSGQVKTGVWRVSGRCLKGVCRVSQRCQKGISGMSEWFVMCQDISGLVKLGKVKLGQVQ